jgi:DNA mismatch repair ATPase MutS
MNKIRNKLDIFFKLSESLSLLDMLKSFVEYNITNTASSLFFKTPVFNANGYFHLENTLHPILKATENESSLIRLKSTDSPVIKLSQNRPMMLIFGPNMSGKTTTLKQMGCLQIMAQNGCFIPTSTLKSGCNFGIVKQMLSVSNDCSDSLKVLTQSSFEQEMFEINSILKSLTPNSVVLVDELCRSTYFLEGFALSLALCDYLLREVLDESGANVFVLFATHFKHLAYLSTIHPKVGSLTLKPILKKDTEFKIYNFNQEGIFCITEYNVFSLL